MIKRFGGNGRGTVYERLASLRQIGGVEEYVPEFELLVAQAKPSVEDQILGYFLAGLVEAMSSKVILMMPKNQELSKDSRFKNNQDQDSRLKIQESREDSIKISTKNVFQNIE